MKTNALFHIPLPCGFASNSILSIITSHLDPLYFMILATTFMAFMLPKPSLCLNHIFISYGNQ
jgi:hypothetical protein